MVTDGNLKREHRVALSRVTASAFAFFSIMAFPQAFMAPVGSVYYAGLPGFAMGCGAATAGTWAFVQCPRHVGPKLVTLALLVPTLYFSFLYIAAYWVHGFAD